MKLEDLKVGAVIMHADRKENCAHTGDMWLVTKLHISKVEVICLNSRDPYRVGETELILLNELPHYDLITNLYVPLATKPTEPQKDLYLRWAFGKKTSLGKIGDKTPYKIENGRRLIVGDIVKISREGEEHGGCLVVHDKDDGYYIMGIAADCNDRKCEIKHWNVTLESDFYNRLKGDTYATCFHSTGVEVVDFIPEE